MKRWIFAAVLGSCASLAHAQTQTTPAPAPQPKHDKLATPVNNNQAGSIAQRMQANGNSLFRATLEATPEPGQATLKDVSFTYVPDPEPHVVKKHDIVNVIVREESAFSAKGTTDLKRQSALDAKLDAYLKLNLSNYSVEQEPQGSTAPEIKGEASRNFKGEATVDRADSLTARIEAEVIDVKPNGTLVLQGSKTIKTDEEEQKFILTGICRASDVSADNSILSSSLFDLTLEKQHKGAVRDTTERGWFTKLLDLIKPF